MGINASQLRSSNVESWSPEDVGSFLGSLGGEEFEAAKLACVKRGVNGQMLCQLAGDPLVCTPYMENLGLKSRESRHKLRHNLQVVIHTSVASRNKDSPRSPGLDTADESLPSPVSLRNKKSNDYLNGANDILGGPIKRPSYLLNALQCAVTEDEVGFMLASLTAALDKGGLGVSHRKWVEQGTCKHICFALQQFPKHPSVQVAGLRAMAEICKECQPARKELGNVCSACSFPPLAIMNNLELPDVAAAACKAAAALVNDITPHFAIDVQTAYLQNINHLVDAGMYSSLEVVFTLVDTLERAAKDHSFPNAESMMEEGGKYSLLESACLCVLCMSSIAGKVRGSIVEHDLIVNGLMLGLKFARKKESPQLSVISARAFSNLVSDREDCACLGQKMQVCVEVTQLMGIMYRHEDTVGACCTALANICQCSPNSSLHIAGANGCAAFSKALEAMKNSRKTVELLLMSIATVLAEVMPDLQEQMGINKIGQHVVSSMRAHEDDVTIQRTACKVLMLLARGHTENQKRLGLSGSCEAIVEAMQKFPLDQEIQEQGCKALFCLSQYLLNAPNLCALGAVKIILKSLDCAEELTSFNRVSTALGTLRNIACKGPTPAKAVANEGVVKPILNLIDKMVHESTESNTTDALFFQPASPNGEAILQGACQVISEIASIPVTNADFCKNRGYEIMVEALAWLHGRPCSIIVEWLKTIVFLAYHHSEAKRRLVTFGISHALNTVLQCNPSIESLEAGAETADDHYTYDSSIVYHAMLCISTIAWELDEELSNRLYNVVPLCTAFLSSQVVLNDQEALERTCISIDYLAAGKPLFQKLFHAAGVVPMLIKVLDLGSTNEFVVESFALSALCSICDGSPEACLSFYDANGLSFIMPSSEGGRNINDCVYFLASALLRTSDVNYEQITPVVVSGVSELGQLRGREGIADDALTTLYAICNLPTENRLECFMEKGGMFPVLAAFMKNPDSPEVAILATDTLTRYLNTGCGSSWFSSLCYKPETGSPLPSPCDKNGFFELKLYVQVLAQALNLVKPDYLVKIMKFIIYICERGGMVAYQAIMSVQVYDSICMAMKPSFFEHDVHNSTIYNMVSGAKNDISPEIVELFETFLNVVEVLCCSTVDETSLGKTGTKAVHDNVDIYKDYTAVIIDSSCVEKVVAILTTASSYQHIRELGRRILHIVILSPAAPAVVTCQENWACVAVTCICSAISFGNSDELYDAVETLRLGQLSRVIWRDHLIAKGLSECLTKAVLCHKYHMPSLRSISLLIAEICGNPPSPQYARDFSSFGQALCESMAYWSDQVSEYDERVIGSEKWIQSIDVLEAATTALSCLSCSFTTNKLLVAAGAVEMVCDTITCKNFAKRDSVPSSLIVCLTNLLGNLFAWPGNKGTNYELVSLASATSLLSKWAKELCDEEDNESVAGVHEKERVVYCHFIQTICSANPSLVEVIVHGGAPAALSAILHSCTLSLSPSVTREAFVAIQSICNPMARNLSKEGLSTVWKCIVSALNTCVLDVSTVEEGLLAMSAIVLKDLLESELLLDDLKTMIIPFLDTYSVVETIIEAALVLLANVRLRLRTEDGSKCELSIPGLSKRMAMAVTKFRFNDCIVDAVKECL